MPLIGDDPSPENRLHEPVIGTSRQKSIVTEIKGDIPNLSNSSAKHLHVSFFKGPKARSRPAESVFRKFFKRFEFLPRHDILEPIGTEIEHRIGYVDAHISDCRDRDDRHPGRVRTAEFKVIFAA